MRMRTAVVLAALVTVVALTGCKPEPASTVTATVAPRDCLNQNMYVSGKVTPAAATKGVVLQRTSGGKWVDFAWYSTQDSGEVRAPIKASVNQSSGNFAMTVVREYWGQQLDGTYHFRVRTEGSGGVSPSWYAKFQTCP